MASGGHGASSDSCPWTAHRAGELHLRAAADGSVANSKGCFWFLLESSPACVVVVSRKVQQDPVVKVNPYLI